MPRKVVPLNGGLVTSKDPSLLDEGELARADDSEYKPNDPGIWKIPGRTAFNSTGVTGAIVGARYLEFEGADDVLVVSHSTNYSQATVGFSGTFANLASSITPGKTLDSVHYNNQHILINGSNRNQFVDSDLVVSNQGMLANTTAPTIILESGGFQLASGNTIDYWIEERVKDGDTIVRRNTSTSEEVVTLTGTGATNKPTIARPSTVNSDATHWALYSSATNGLFPTGAELFESEIINTGGSDTRTTANPLLPDGDVYEVVTVEIAGLSLIAPKNGPPPIATTGDVFEDSVVINDVSDASRIHYSFPDNIHAYPAVNFIRFETKEADEVKLIRSMGKFIVVGLRDSIWRVETLPRPEDAAFQRERVKAQIHGAQGAVSPTGGALFSFGQGPRLAYVARYGILITDGFSWDVLTDDIDWENDININGLDSAVLINNPKRYRLEFYDGARAYYLHYHPSHAKEAIGGGFRAKVTGPITSIAQCAAVGKIGGVDFVFAGYADGKLYLEGHGNSDASLSGGINHHVVTKDEYFAGVGNESQEVRTWSHHQKGADNQSATIGVIRSTEGEDEHKESCPVAYSRRELTAMYADMRGEAFAFSIENSDALGQIRTDYFVADFKDLREATG